MWKKSEREAGAGESCLEGGSHGRDKRGGKNGDIDEASKLKTPP